MSVQPATQERPSPSVQCGAAHLRGGPAAGRALGIAHYEPRATRSLGLGRVGPLTVKWYLITIGSKTLTYAQRRDIQDQLGGEIDGAGDPLEHGVGFGIVHRARDGDYVLLSRWYDRNMLKHRVYRVQLDDTDRCRLELLRDTDIVACVWEMALMAHERDAWVAAMREGLGDAAVRTYLYAQYPGATV